MKTFSAFTMVRQPVDAVWLTMRDRLCEVGAAIEDLDRIEQIERAVQDQDLRFVNRWVARQKVPALLRQYLGSENISWIDRAFWREADRVCEWSVEPSVLSDHIECAGKTRYETAMGGRGARVTFDGYFSLKPGFAGALPRSLEPVVASFLESIVSTVVPRNLARAITAAGELAGAARS